MQAGGEFVASPSVHPTQEGILEGDRGDLRHQPRGAVVRAALLQRGVKRLADLGRLAAVPLPELWAGVDDRAAFDGVLDVPDEQRADPWGHAVVDWDDGTRREGWLRADDGMDFTAAVAAETATRLAYGMGRPGAFTPAMALGPDLATAAGGTFLLA